MSKLWSGMELGALSAESGQLPVIVRYHPTVDRAAQGRDGEGLSIRRHYRKLPLVAMSVSALGLSRLEQDPTVVRIWPDLPVCALLDTAVPLVQAPAVWALGVTGKGVRMAILDTGIDPNHPDLADRLVASTDLTGEGPWDGHGHGTHIAGIAAGTGAASNGRYRGVAPAAEVCSAKVLRADGGGMTSTVIAGLEWAVDQGARVINLSLGSAGSSDGTDALSLACDTMVAEGVAVCVAAGNEGPGNYTVGSPGAAREAITVGACTLDGRVAAFSSRGPTADDRIKPDLLCPGVSIASCRAAGTHMGAVLDEHYTVASGTSMATSIATGLVALLLETYPGMTPAEVKKRLMATAVDLGLNAYDQGTGRADALRAHKDERRPSPADPPSTPALPRSGCLGSLAPLLRTLLGRRSQWQ